MSDQIRIRSIALAAPLLVWGVGIGLPMNAARAEECLAAPNAATPKGGHWYYHTDRAKHRKCWYLVTPDGSQPNAAAQTTSATTPAAHVTAVKKPASAPAGATKPTSHAASAPPLPAAKAQPAPKPGTASSATAFESFQQGVEAKTAAPAFPPAPAPQASESPQAGAPAATAAPTVPIIWPDLRPVETIKIRKPNSDTSDARARPVPMNLDAQPPEKTRNAPTANAPATRAAAMTDSPAVTPLQMALAIVAALALAGILYHLVIRIAERRSRRINIDYTPPVWADDRPQRVRRDEPRPQAQLHEEPQRQGRARWPEQRAAAGEQFVDSSRASLVPAASEDGVRRPPLGVDASPYKPRRKSVAAPATGGVNTHENNLARLIQDLDQLLQTRKGA
jgi:hypothetical protein